MIYKVSKHQLQYEMIC